MKNIIFLAMLAFSLLPGCSYTINHTPVQISYIANIQGPRVTLVVPRDSQEYVYTHHRGTDTWSLMVGAALVDISRQLFSSHFASLTFTGQIPGQGVMNESDKIVVLSLTKFEPDIGWTVFSSHDGTVTLEVTVQNGKGVELVHKTIVGKSSAAGRDKLVTWGVLLFTPAGVMGYNEAMEEMITKCLVDAIGQAVEIVP